MSREEGIWVRNLKLIFTIYLLHACVNICFVFISIKELSVKLHERYDFISRPIVVEWYPVRWTTQSPLHFTPWQTCSFQHQFDLFGKYSATL